jgi:hypothetical protein
VSRSLIHAKFDVRKHEEHGDLGLAMRGRSWAEPFGPRAAVHDMMEHFPRDTGRLEEELQALGAMLFVRGDTYFRLRGSYYSAAMNCSADFRNLTDWLHNNENRERIDKPPRIKPCDADYAIDEAISEAIHLAESEEYDPSWIVREHVAGWMRRGYRRAVLRYKGRRMVHTFIDAENQLQKFMKYAEEGEWVRCAINKETGEVKLWTPN